MLLRTKIIALLKGENQSFELSTKPFSKGSKILCVRGVGVWWVLLDFSFFVLLYCLCALSLQNNKKFAFS